MAILLSWLNVTSALATPPVEIVGASERVCNPGAESQDVACVSLSDLHTEKSDRPFKFEAPKGFNETNLAAARDDERGEGFYVFGQDGLNLAPYVAFAPKGSVENVLTWEFFAGRGISGSTHWIGFDQWQNHYYGKEIWNFGKRAMVFDADTGSGLSCGQFQAQWNPQLARWLLIYACQDQIYVRAARRASGPWTDAASLPVPEPCQECLLELLPQQTGSLSVGESGRTTQIHWSLTGGRLVVSHYFRTKIRQEGP